MLLNKYKIIAVLFVDYNGKIQFKDVVKFTICIHYRMPV